MSGDKKDHIVRIPLFDVDAPHLLSAPHCHTYYISSVISITFLITHLIIILDATFPAKTLILIFSRTKNTLHKTSSCRNSPASQSNVRF